MAHQYLKLRAIFSVRDRLLSIIMPMLSDWNVNAEIKKLKRRNWVNQCGYVVHYVWLIRVNASMCRKRPALLAVHVPFVSHFLDNLSSNLIHSRQLSDTPGTVVGDLSFSRHEACIFQGSHCLILHSLAVDSGLVADPLRSSRRSKSPRRSETLLLHGQEDINCAGSVRSSYRYMYLVVGIEG
jgi:hypothetical protein